MEHVSRSILPNNEMRSAPKKFNVWGLKEENDVEPILFGIQDLMMQQRRHQSGQSKILLRTILDRQLSTIGSQSMKPRRLTTLFPAIIRMLVHSSAITSSSLSTTILSSSYLPSSIVNGERINNNARNNSGVPFCSSLLLSLLAWSVTLLLISSCFGIADAGVIMGHPLGKRSYIDLGCKGVYDKSIFARLDRVCEDCYNLFREPTLHTLCSFYLEVKEI
ncbi:hypothetical protein PV327_007318 [Microctonus hyperodae]|uniref:Uncharacterized protein n=1 Tax=Microctonus hyperodae TaxID=165561 RepID=A0AA39F660_MICHY|nr:hypothetical protein PV327_007318 [Microctonus hyperodae]